VQNSRLPDASKTAKSVKTVKTVETVTSAKTVKIVKTVKTVKTDLWSQSVFLIVLRVEELCIGIRA
jgi:hypothetical protein